MKNIALWLRAFSFWLSVWLHILIMTVNDLTLDYINVSKCDSLWHLSPAQAHNQAHNKRWIKHIKSGWVILF